MISGLEISSIEKHDFMKLPSLYIQDEIPVTQEQTATQEAISKWDYLNEVKLVRIDAEVGLLIGRHQI